MQPWMGFKHGGLCCHTRLETMQTKLIAVELLAFVLQCVIESIMTSKLWKCIIIILNN